MQDLPFRWGDHSLMAPYSKFGLFADAGPKDAKQCGHSRLVHANRLYYMFYLTENTKQLALCSLLCDVYKMIITPKKRQQELSTSQTNHLQSGTLTQWCQNTFSFPLEQSYYFRLANRREKSSFKPMGKEQIHRETRVAGELTELLGGEDELLQERTSEGKGCLTEKRLQDYPRASHPYQRKSVKRQCHLNDSNGCQIIIPSTK